MSKRKSYDAIYLRQYRANHPERTKQWELNTARNKLCKAGYQVTKPTKKKALADMTDDELREALEEKRRRNREACNRWRSKNKIRFLEYQKAYRKKNRQAAADLKAEIDRRQNNGE